MFVAHRYKDEVKAETLLNILKFVAAFFAIVTIYSVFDISIFGTVFSFMYGSGERLIQYANEGIYAGIAGEPSYNAYCISTGAFICLIDILYFNKRKFLNVLIVCISMIAIMLTEKRSFLLIVPTIFMLLIWVSSGKHRFQKFFIFGFIGLMTISIVVQVFPDAFSFWDKMLTADKTINLNYRDVIWGIALTRFSENPIFGVGINRFDVYFNEYYLSNFSYYTYQDFAGAHNIYFQFLAELGAVGLIFVIIVMVYELRKAFMTLKNANVVNHKKIQRYTAFSLSIQLLTMSYGLSGNTMHQYQQLLMYIVAIGMSHYCSEYIKSNHVKVIGDT
jgi:O-antigen ligase